MVSYCKWVAEKRRQGPARERKREKRTEEVHQKFTDK
jgi:hypothetical protein